MQQSDANNIKRKWGIFRWLLWGSRKRDEVKESKEARMELAIKLSRILGVVSEDKTRK